MEWVETTAKTVDEARDAALDQLGVALDEAEVEVVEEPRAGLFGRVRGSARVRARVRPTQVRPKQDRRRRGRAQKAQSGGGGTATATERVEDESDTAAAADSAPAPAENDAGQKDSGEGAAAPSSAKRGERRRGSKQKNQEKDMSNHEQPESDVSPQEVGDAAVTFMNGLATAFGNEVETELRVDGTELDVAVSGENLGLMVGSGGRTLNAIQDLARVAAQRRLGDHETRLRIDVAGYRERRQAALAAFAREVADQVRSSGEARSMEPMLSADRKVIHDVLNEEDGVSSRSEGEDPNRRIVVVPAD